MRTLTTFAALLVAVTLAQGQMSSGPWIQLFKGIDYAVGTNWPDGNSPIVEQQSVRCVRVDLTDPDVQLFATPRAPNYAADSRETLSLSVSNFLKTYGLKIALDSNFYSANPGADPTSEGLPMEVFGLQISAGSVVSVPEASWSAPGYASLLFTTNKQPIVAFNNVPPGANTAGIYTAVTGYYPVLSNGVNIGEAAITDFPNTGFHQAQPRTAFGVSQDRRYLFLLTIDGRQNGYSDGALDAETGLWMYHFGAWDAINMDGGGSTAIYRADAAGNPVPLTHSSYVAGSGRERFIGSHFGVFAQPLQTTNFPVVMLFDVTNTWKYATNNLDGANWQAPGYDDSDWISGPGLFWADGRGPNADIPLEATQMPANPITTYPFVTYYFRTHFNFPGSPAGATLTLSNYIDDGAVFYLNGIEIYRAFMPASPIAISNATLAAGYNCASGNATCPLVFTLAGDSVTNLMAGDNVLAVEAHNYVINSPDVTFGAALFYSGPPQPPRMKSVAAPMIAGAPALISFFGMAGQSYTVLYRHRLESGAWLPLTTVPTMESSQVVTVPDDSTLGQPQRFYSIVTPAM